MKKKLILINPVNNSQTGLNINKSLRYPPLGLGIVAALTPETWDIEIIDENFEEFKFIQADLVGITSFTSNVNRAYEIASIYRNKSIPVILGGIHASTMPDEALNHVDCVVIGEAEGVWVKIINDFESCDLKNRYISNDVDLSSIPVPKRELFNSEYRIGTIQTTRGCPNNCDFCSVTSISGAIYRYRPIKQILDELELIPQDKIFFVDDNLVGSNKTSIERCKKLFKGIIQRGIKKEWFCQSSLNFGKDKEFLRLASESGCRMVFIGLETENQEQLCSINKKINMSEDPGKKYSKTLKLINQHGIIVIGSFIFGFEDDTKEKMSKRADFINKCGVDIVQMTYLTPLPGSNLFSRLANSGSLFHDNFPIDWNRYDLGELTVLPSAMEAQEVVES
ncbi:B12-binding domain-containing radical SAM protein, partial [bacterium]|nr:B12-binding domain-containing radical SAM protein [bacterium]